MVYNMEIKHSLDWQKVNSQLRKQLSQVNYNPDLHHMLKNIDHMVTELSKDEVVARQTRRTTMWNNQLEKINKSINHLEKLILIAQVMD